MFICDGFYGNLNAGDDFFQVIIAKYAGESAVFTSNENISGRDMKYIGPNRFRGYQKLRMLLLLCRYKKFLSAGGSVFENRSVFFSFRNLAILLSRVLPIRLEAIGVSVNDVSENADVWFYDRILTRDKMNVDKPRVSHGTDLAYLWLDDVNPYDDYRRKNELKRVGLIHCPYETVRGLDAEYEIERDKNYMRLASLLAKQSSLQEIVVIVLNGHHSDGDNAKANDIINNLKGLNANVKLTKQSYTDNPVLLLEAIEKLDFVITTRLHGAIFSHITQTPFVLFEYHRKCTDWLNEIGSPSEMRINDGSVTDSQFLKIIDNPLVVGFDSDLCHRIAKTKEALNAFINHNT